MRSNARCCAVRPFAPARIILVVGCGGDRDRGKRPIMGEIAERLADVVILTSDNPRTEDPERILDEIEAGMQRPHERIEDRKEAIARALDIAGDGRCGDPRGEGTRDLPDPRDDLVSRSTRRRSCSALAHAATETAAVSFWTRDRVAQALGDQLCGARIAGEQPFARVVTDTRALASGDLFVALIGERFDAHDFLAEAVERGAAAVVVSEPARAAGLGVPVFAVDDTTRALGALGSYRRRAWGGPVVAVAGSNGKTSTKELIAAALAPRFAVHATRGNLNNHVGVPLTLLAIPDDAEIAVVEIGTNHPGEVAMLRALVEPDIAVVTSIGEEHLEGLGDLAGVLREESAIYHEVSLAIAPAGQPEIGGAARAMGCRVVEAGTERGDIVPSAFGLAARRPRLGDARRDHADGPAARDCTTCGMPCWRSPLRAPAASPTRSRRRGSPRSPRFRCAARSRRTARSPCSTTPTTPIPPRRAKRSRCSPRSARGARRSPSSARCWSWEGRRRALHEEIAHRALASDAQVIAGVGEFVRRLRGARRDGDARVVTAADAEALWPLLAPRLEPNAVVLLKGSRGTRLERLVPHLKAFAGVAPPPPAA